MDIDKLINEIKINSEWLATIDGDELECISLENLQSILTNFLNIQINLS